MTEPAGYATYPSLRDRTVFITGGATGIGAEFVAQFARSLARDLGSVGIRVNCLIPGWTMTERQLAGWVTPEAEREIDRAQCLPGRLQPADIARMALWLAADDSRMCTSQTWIVDGGWT
jgi:NAD(P)-dependent dehydrogenase (short-subunit alcohol dehydrogenase family)